MGRDFSFKMGAYLQTGIIKQIKQFCALGDDCTGIPHDIASGQPHIHDDNLLISPAN
jgi:hypothetical protein